MCEAAQAQLIRCKGRQLESIRAVLCVSLFLSYHTIYITMFDTATAKLLKKDY